MSVWGIYDKKRIFSRDRSFYNMLLRLVTAIMLQNIVAYSINMADNMMLGAFSQAALSGAATVNQIQFMIQQLAFAIGDSVIVIGSQYWGKRNTAPIRQLTVFALGIGLLLGAAVFTWTSIDPGGILKIFTGNADYISEGTRYLSLMRFTYPVFILSSVLMASLRAVEIVGLSLRVSLVSLAVDVSVNYVLIFGKLGFPTLGIYGAAIGTLTARIIELVLIVLYLIFVDKRLMLYKLKGIRLSNALFSDFCRVLWPSALSNFLWSIATPVQTSVLGHLSDSAIAANSVSTTFFQYLKIVAVSEASASSVIIGKTVGESSDDLKIREYSRTLQVFYLFFGVALGLLLFILRTPLLSVYTLTPEALRQADGMLIVLSVVMVGMSYQMPVGIGIIKGGGDVKYMMYLNLISTWLIVMPLSFIAAFVWKLDAVWVVAVLNCDQLFKCVPMAIHCNRYKWIRRLTKSKI